GEGRGDVPRGDAGGEGNRQEVRAQAADRLGTDRPRGGRAARAGGDQGHRPAPPRPAAEGRVRRADRARRSRGNDAARGRADRDRPAHDRDLRALRHALRPLLAIDGDSFAHRAYHALPKTIRGADRRPAGAIVGFTNMLMRLWEAEQPRAVLVAW